ncbi:MAG TPA: hypothetical protein GXZ48_04195 [Acholeplasmataceae bacterium]|nr:hypothetical protein [Acholeplasmataceae bacterium]
MKRKKHISITSKFFIVMVLVAVLIALLFIGYFSISSLISTITTADEEKIISSLEVVQGFLLIMIFFNISFIGFLGILLNDVFKNIRESEYIAEISKIIFMIDQQKSLDKLDIYNDRLVKVIGNYAANVNKLEKVYDSLYNIYLMKTMKTEADFEKLKMYITILMKAYAESYNMQEVYVDRKIQKIAEAGAFYDLGKLGVPGYILYKESYLDQHDFELAKRHAKVGYDIMMAIKPDMEMGTFEQYIRDIVGFHHERYDGTGYPYGKKGEEIPFIARIIALITTYDTVTRDRPYKKAISHEEAVELVNKEKGHYFDPKIVKVFNGVEKEFKKILLREDL